MTIPCRVVQWGESITANKWRCAAGLLCSLLRESSLWVDAGERLRHERFAGMRSDKDACEVSGRVHRGRRQIDVFLPELQAMVGRGLITRETVVVLRYSATTSGKSEHA